LDASGDVFTARGRLALALFADFFGSVRTGGFLARWARVIFAMIRI